MKKNVKKRLETEAQTFIARTLEFTQTFEVADEALQ